jgi:hypothetical protein
LADLCKWGFLWQTLKSKAIFLILSLYSLELSLELQKGDNDKVILELSLYCQKWFINHIRLVDQNLVSKIKAVAGSEMDS